MRTWTRSPLKEAICGGPCKRTIRRGEPVLEIRIAGIKAVFRRCTACAEETAPTDLPPLVEPMPIVATPYIRTGANALPFDHKMAAAGREPGEDG